MVPGPLDTQLSPSGARIASALTAKAALGHLEDGACWSHVPPVPHFDALLDVPLLGYRGRKRELGGVPSKTGQAGCDGEGEAHRWRSCPQRAWRPPPLLGAGLSLLHIKEHLKHARGPRQGD